jgi:hypothetical protein
MPVTLIRANVSQVGYDQHGYGYRDLEGSKVSAMWQPRQCCDRRVDILQRTFAIVWPIHVQCSTSARSTTCLPLVGQVHKGLREEYGEPYREGDVIGCLLHLPSGGRPLVPTRNVSMPPCILCCADPDCAEDSCASCDSAPSFALMQLLI